MADFKRRPSGGKSFGGNRGGFSGGRPSFQKKSWGGAGGRDRGPVTLHQAVCAECGKSCEVPFRPTGDKPVYCNACFGGKKDYGDARAPRYQAPVRSDAGAPIAASNTNNDEVKKQLELLNTKMDRLIGVIEMMAAPKEAPAAKAKKTLKK